MQICTNIACQLRGADVLADRLRGAFGCGAEGRSADGRYGHKIYAPGSPGVVVTRKDVSGTLARLPESVPLWFLAERIEWVSGGAPLRRRVREAAST